MSGKTGPHAPRAPIALQIMGLLLVVLLLAQALTFAVIVWAPPPRPMVYRMDEIAAALHGETVQPRDGRALHRLIQSAKPAAPPTTDRFRIDGGRRLLAETLAVPEAKVVLFQKPPSLMSRFLSAPGGGGRQPLRGLRGAPGDASARPPGPARQAGQAGPPRSGGDRRGPRPPGSFRGFRFIPVIGEFTAALQQADGRWMVVRPEPAPFPTDWQKRMAMWLFGCLLLAAPAGYLFARRITAPLRDFARAADALGRDPNAPVMTLKGPAEIGAAARAFNEMQTRLKRYVADRTAMVGAISHDLRTPLARMRFKLEGAPPEMKAAVLKDVGQMEEMVTAVLSFIRDASQPSRRERLDLLSLIECAVDDAALSGAAVTLEEGPPLLVEADPLGLQRLFANLIDNAGKYAQRARVRLFQRDGEAVVEIADEGPGLPDTELERVFTPFYRSSTARTLDEGGVGLGLAVARSIALAHGGDVSLARSETGLTATVRLPLAAVS